MDYRQNTKKRVKSRMRNHQTVILAILAVLLCIGLPACNNYGLADQLETPGKTQGLGSGFTLVNTIFVTLATFNGNLGGVAGADNLCRNDAANPMGSGNGFWKALISMTGARVACTTSDCSGSGAAEHLDWVLKANTPYTRADGTPIGATNANGVFVGTLVNSVATNAVVVFTGLTSNWVVAGDNCSGWSSPSIGFNGQTGLGDQTGILWFSNTANGCDVPSKALYCVQQ